MTKAYGDFMADYPWELFVTLTFSGRHAKRATTANAYNLINNEFIRPLIKVARLQVASIGVMNTLCRPHAHLLLLGHSRFGKTLHDVPYDYLQSLWRFGSLDAKSYWSRGAADYTALNLTLNAPDASELLMFNIRLLKRLKLSACSDVPEAA